MTGAAGRTAIDHEPTAAALARRRWKVYGFALLAPLSAVAFPILYATTDLWGIPIYAGPLGLIVAVVLEVRWRRLRRLLASAPWVTRQGRHHVIGGGRYTFVVLVLDADEHGPEVLCEVREPGWWTHDVLGPQGPVEVWVAGDPGDRAVATLGGDRFTRIAPPRWGRWRRLLRRWVDEREAGRRPDVYPVPTARSRTASRSR